MHNTLEIYFNINFHTRVDMTVQLDYIIHTDQFCAVQDEHELGRAQGWGKTRAQAIADLLDNIFEDQWSGVFCVKSDSLV